MSRRSPRIWRRTTGTSGGAPVKLPVTAGLMAWYRADLGVTTVGGRVSQWKDSSGIADANRNLVQGVAGSRPTFVASSANFNNQPVFTYASADPDSLISVGAWSVAIVQPCTIFSVHRVTSLATQVTYFDDQTVNGSFGLIQSFGGGFSARAPTNLGGFDNTLNEQVVWCTVYNGASSSVFKNQKTANVTGNIGANGSTGLIVGLAAGGASGHAGDMAEVIVYSGALSVGDRSSLFDYLGLRYGIAIGA